ISSPRSRARSARDIESEVRFDRAPRPLYAGWSLHVTWLPVLELPDQGWLHGKDSIGVEELRLLVEDVRRHRLEARSGDGEMNVCRSPRLPARGSEHRAYRTGLRNRVRHRAHAEQGIRPGVPSAQGRWTQARRRVW